MQVLDHSLHDASRSVHDQGRFDQAVRQIACAGSIDDGAVVIAGGALDPAWRVVVLPATTVTGLGGVQWYATALTTSHSVRLLSVVTEQA
jgi:hypothetical protein